MKLEKKETMSLTLEPDTRGAGRHPLILMPFPR